MGNLVHRRYRYLGGVDPDADFVRLSARAGGLLFLLSGLVGIVYGLSLGGPGPAGRVIVVACVVPAIGGVVILRLPWHRWHQRALLTLVPPALALIGLSNWVDPNPYLGGVFFFLLAMWIGVAQPMGTTLALSPLFALAYWAPMAVVAHAAGLGRSVAFVIAVCVLAGESLSWLATRLRIAQRRLRDHDERRYQRELTRQAFADQLTGLPNRALLQDRAEQALHQAGRHGQLVGLLLIDLNRFKDVNDTLGHRTGDIMLRQAADRLRVAVRDTDTVARLGGDEFAVLLPQISTVEDAIGVAEKLQAAIADPFLVEGLSLDIDASIGLSTYPQHARSPEELMQRADVAMYAAKAGHQDYVVYEPRLDEHNPRRLRLLSQLRRAIATGELVVFYQPKAEAHSGRAIGLEALVRWQHPEYGLIGPDEFIPLAETTGLIRPLTSFVLDTALRECASWIAAGHELTVAVNVSARCLLDLSLPAEVTQLLDKHHLDPARLVLEITESAIMTEPNRALEILNRLHGLGVRLSIDDFGTGYSSMAYLKNLPVQELKVDRSFVAHMRDKQNVHVIVRSTVDLGHDLGLEVVAEGVEDAATWRELNTLGCDVVQGYYLSKPMAPARLVAWLDTHQPAAPTKPY